MGMFSKIFGSDDESQQLPDNNAQTPTEPVKPTEPATTAATSPAFAFEVPAFAAGEMKPLSIDLVKAHFDAEGYNYGVIEADPAEGQRERIESGWDGVPFLISFNGNDGEILTVFAQSPVDIPLDLEDQLDAFVENWHREHYFPKVYTRRAAADTALRICCEHSIDLEHGVTEKQLGLQMHCAIATSLDVIKSGYGELGISLEETE